MAETEPETRSYISWPQAAFIGVAAMVGAGIFSLLGAAGEIAGAAVWLSFTLAGIIAAIQGYSFAKLGAHYPSAAGLLEYVRRGFGDGHFTGITAWMTYSVNTIVTAMVAVSFGSYASAMFANESKVWAKVFAALIVLLMTGVNIMGSTLVARAQSVIVLTTGLSQLHGLSVKVRGGRSLEVKVYRGGAGILDVAGRARGRMESWQKWSFPGSPLDQYSGDPAGWRPVRKRRRISWFSFASGQIVAGAPGLDQEPRCDVELTEVSTRGQDWWTLGFEASGPADLLRSALEGTARLLFTHPLPGAEPGLDESGSYMQWLFQQPGHKSDADA